MKYHNFQYLAQKNSRHKWNLRKGTNTTKVREVLNNLPVHCNSQVYMDD